MGFDLKNKVGLILGVANKSSIAYGCANVLRNYKARLILTYKDAKAEPFVRPIAEELQADMILPCDVRDDLQIDELFEQIQQKYKKIDFLLHSIAFAPEKDLTCPVIDCSREGFNIAMDISCFSLIKIVRRAAPLMRDGGEIITISYYGGEKVIKHYNIMGVVKAALESSVKYLAYDLGPKNIRINAISPGPISTRAASGILEFGELICDAEARSPLKHLADITSVGELAAFLVSDNAQNITGQVLFVDAGYSIMG